MNNFQKNDVMNESEHSKRLEEIIFSKNEQIANEELKEDELIIEDVVKDVDDLTGVVTEAIVDKSSGEVIVNNSESKTSLVEKASIKYLSANLLEKYSDNNTYFPTSKKEMEELTSSIKTNGLIEPLVVGYLNNKYIIAGGNSRFDVLLSILNDGETFKFGTVNCDNAMIPCRIFYCKNQEELDDLAVNDNVQKKITKAGLMKLIERYVKCYNSSAITSESIFDYVARRTAKSPRQIRRYIDSNGNFFTKESKNQILNSSKLRSKLVSIEDEIEMLIQTIKESSDIDSRLLAESKSLVQFATDLKNLVKERLKEVNNG